MTPDEIMGQARLIVRARAPYFRAMLLSFVPREVEGLGTIGVTDRALLLYDPAFIAKLSVDECAFILCHEIGHLLHKHGARCGSRDKRLWNMAGDLAINPSLLDMGFLPPQGQQAGLFPKQFGWEDGLAADEYYRLLQEKAEENAKKHKGACGSCSGNPIEGEPKSKGKQPGEGEGKGESKPGKGNGPEDVGEGRTEAQLSRAIRGVAEAIKEHAKQRGSVPSGLERWADSALEPPKVPWRSLLARSLRSAVAYRAGANVYRYDGPSRRQAGIGYGDGKPTLPRLRQTVPRVAIVADTSGSMSERDLGAALREAKGVLSAVGAEVTFCTCDAQVHGIKPVRQLADMAKMLKGGGGTAFTPALEALAALKPAPELVVFATDGYGDDPAPIKGLRVIWLLVGKRPGKPASWGETIHIED